MPDEPDFFEQFKQPAVSRQPAGRPDPADFDLHESFLIERSYDPHVPAPRPNGKTCEEIDHFPILEPYSKVWSVPVKWLWPGRIPLGKITLLAGDPGVGKSRLAVDLAARVSAGLPWPDDPPGTTRYPSNVILFTAEDCPDEGVLGWLKEAGADLERVFSFEAVGRRWRNVRKHATRPFRIPDDVPGLEAVLQNREPVGLVVIDTLADYWGGNGTNHNAQVREMLAPLIDVANRRNTAILCLSHLNKSSGIAGLYRMMGSLAFTALARSVWGVARAPNDPERRLFLPVKTNLTLPPTGLGFRIDGERVVWETEPLPDTWQAIIESELQEEKREVRLLKIDLAIEWLRGFLSEQPVPRSEVVKRGVSAGISYGSLIRAKRELRIESDRSTSFDDRASYWRLPK